jgi:cytosine deaminase
MSRPDPHDELDRLLLDAALEQARKGEREGGVPIGAALGLIGERGPVVVALGHNLRVQSGDTTAHAEVVCLRNAGRRNDWSSLTLASTLSPCVMCTGAALLHRVGRVVIGENRTFLGGEDLLRARSVPLKLADDPRCVEIMDRFVRANRDLWDEDIGVPRP